MRLVKFLLLFAIVIVISSFKNEKPETHFSTDYREFYQLKIYTFKTEAQQLLTDTYLENAYLPSLKKLNIPNVGVFKNRITEKDSIIKTYVLIPFSNINQFLDLETSLENDTAYISAGANYIEAKHDAKPYSRIESVLMKAFIDMPQMKATSVVGKISERVYELRSYESPTEAFYKRKVDMFNAGGEVKLFKRLNFNAVFYAEVISGSKMPNLMYMTTFENMKIRDSLWEEFRESPEWTALKVIPKYQKTVSRADIMLLYPTEYSDY